MANNSDRSVEIPIYLRLDKKSYDQVNEEIARTAAKATVTTNDLRARRGLPPRVSRSTPNVDIRQIAEKVAFDVASSMGESGKLAKAIAEKLGKSSFDLALPKITFDSQSLQEFDELPDVVENLREQFNTINDLSRRLSQLTGVARTDIDVSNLNESQLFNLVESSFTAVQKRIIPGLAALDEIYMQTVNLAGQYNIPTSGRISQMQPRAERTLPRGSYREFQSNARTQSVLNQFKQQFEANPDAYSDAISDSIESWGKRLLQQTLDNLNELPEGEQAVEAGAQTLTFWLDDAIEKFRTGMLAAGFQPGTEVEIAEVMTRKLGESIGQAESLILDNLRNLYYTEGSVNLSATGDAPRIADQVRTNPALLTQGRVGHGALAELKKINDQVAAGGQQAEEVLKIQAQSVSEGLEAIVNAGGKFVAAFDTEFVRETANVITEASVVLKDEMGNFYDVFDMLQMPPASQEGLLATARVGARNRQELEARAASLGYTDPLGAGEGVQNLQDFYPKLKALIDVINKLAELGVPLATASGQAADFFSLAKAIQNVNEGIQQNNLNLEPLVAPAGPYSKDTVQKMPLAFPLGMPASGSAEDIQKIAKSLSGAAAGEMKAIADGSMKVSSLLKGLFDQLSDDVKALITITADGFTFEGDPAHTARADAKVTAALYEVLQRLSPVGASPADVTPPSGLDARRQQGVPEEGYEPFLIQLKGMNSVLSNMLEAEKQIFLQKLKGFQASQDQQKLYERQAQIQKEIVQLEKSGAGDAATAQKIDALQREELAIQKVGEANERRFASEVKFNYRQDKFAGQNYRHAAQRVSSSHEIAEADRLAQREIIENMKEHVSATKRVETQNKSLMNTWVTGRYALYDVGNAYEGVGRQLAMVTRRIFEITNAFRSYETAFTSVERTLPSLAATTAGAAEEMRSIKDALIDMSEVMPVAFEELSQIATLGAQMGVSASGIVNFTQTVAQFASITGIAVDTVAQKFGRIAELADVDYSELNNLGSSIAFAGINAVATEAEILTLAESIAAVSNQAGLLPAEIVGVATSLASIGIQAEQARGVFTRVFADIDRAVSRNGEELQNFANIAGMSVDGFAQAWGEDGKSYEVFRALLGGLGATEDLTKAFDSLNIVETREINTLTRLANNLNVVDQAISDATSSFEEATFLGDAFEKTADNLDAKIQILRNNFNAFTESLSKSTSGALINFIDFANDLLQTFKELAANPFFQTGASFGLILTGIATAATFAISGMTKLVAQMYAFRVAAINTANDASSMTGLGSMLKQITGWGAGLVEIRKDIQTISPASRGLITPVTFNAFASFEKKQRDLLANNILLLDSEQLGIEKSRERADSINQLLRVRQAEIAATMQDTSLTEAERIAKLNSIGANKIYVTTTGEIVRGKVSEAEARRQNLIAINAESQAAVTAQRGLRGGISGFASTALGVATALGTVLSVATLAGTALGFIAQQAEKTRINLLSAGGGVASLRDAIRQDTLEYNKLTDSQKRNNEQYVTFTANIQKNTAELDPNAVAVGNITGLSSDFAEQNKKTTTAIEKQTFALGQNTREWLANAIMQDENFQGALEKYPTLLKDAEAAGYNFREVINTIFQDPGAGIDDVLPGILRKRVDLFEEARLAQARATASFDPEEAAAFQERATAYEQEAHKLQLVQEAVESLQTAMGTAIGKNEVFNAIRDIFGLTDAIDDATEGTGELEDGLNGVADSLRTVLDYASDLGGIFSRVIELEFGKQLALDSITKGWRDISKAAEDAAEGIAEANAEIKDLSADRSILEYQLSVAERYGDELRAAKIRAELSQVNKKITDTEEKRAEAEAKSAMSLKGNSESAIENRATILGLVGDYQNYIETLAKLGRSSSQLAGDVDVLKRRFREQAIAAGFSAAEVEEYVSLFDQFGQVAADAPRDVDIEVALGLTAAEQAINEFLAKSRTMGVDVDIDTEPAMTEAEKLRARLIGLGVAFDMTPAEKQIIDLTKPRDVKITADALEHKQADKNINAWLKSSRVISALLEIKIDKTLLDAQAKNFLNLMRSQRVDSVAYKTYQDMYLILNRMKNASFAAGGFVSGPGTGTSDSIPAMLSDGEFVMRATAVRQYGPEFMNALNQQRVGFTPAAAAVRASGQGGAQIVYLSPDDRALLRAVADRPVTLYADNTKIAQSANVGNKKLSQRGVR